ncbi:MAG TPA: hypothetical protein VMU38_06430 [Candidatus Binatia bacterium]|nr:hypothetical protein [Candidatus Binatia bacterium]
MRSFSTAACALVAAALLAGCSGNTSQMTPAGPSTVGQLSKSSHHHNQRPHWTYPANLWDNRDAVVPSYRERLNSLRYNGGATGGIYVNQFYGTAINGYEHKNTANNPPICTVSTGAVDINGISVDGKGNLITPYGEGYTGYGSIVVWQGPGMCGTMLGSVTDTYGQPSDAYSFDAQNGTIVVANIFDTGGAAGSVSVCTLSGGCTANLTNAGMYKVAGVAMDKKGNCWASAEDYSATATLTYFAGCTGSGEAATGFMNLDYGGLDFDKNGNLLSVDKTGQQLWVYSGCNPKCTVVGGPFPLEGESVFGAVNKQSMAFVAGDTGNGTADVYYYSPTSLTYWYSISNGLTASETVEGVDYNPSSK